MTRKPRESPTPACRRCPAVSRESDTVAVDLGDASIAGNVFVIPSPADRRPVLRGRIDLSSTRIDAQLLIRDAVLSRPTQEEDWHYSRARFRGNALTGQRLFVGAEVSIEGNTVIDGGIDLPSADLGGFSIEPGIYLTGDFGVRSEINVALTPEGAEITGGEPQRELLRLLA